MALADVISYRPPFRLTTMIYLLFLASLLLICCNPDRAKDNSKDEIIEYFIPLSHRVEKDVDEVFEEHWYVPLETRDDALIDVLYNIKNIAIFQEDIYIGSGEQLIVWDKYGKFKRVLSKKDNDPQSYLYFEHFMIWPNGDLSIASTNEIVTYSNSHQFINKKRYENVGYIEAITLLSDSL